MTSHPIIMSAQSVRATMDGSKTMTRRVLEPQSATQKFLFNHPSFSRYSFTHMWHDIDDRYCAYFETGPTEDSKYGYAESFPCPYGQPGDLLWVREAFQTLEEFAVKGAIYYRANGEKITATVDDEEYDLSHKWRSPIYMPRWASRLTMINKTVTVQRFDHDIADDAKEHGIIPAGTWVWVIEYKVVEE